MDIYHNSDPASLVEGVPVKISEKFKPPPKISLSASCNHSVNIELLTTEHDFKFDESCINWLKNYKDQKDKCKSEREARLEIYELAQIEKQNKLKEEAERLKKLREDEIEKKNKLREEEIDRKYKLREEEIVMKNEQVEEEIDRKNKLRNEGELEEEDQLNDYEIKMDDTKFENEQDISKTWDTLKNEESEIAHTDDMGINPLSPKQFENSHLQNNFLPENTNIASTKDHQFTQSGIQYNVGQLGINSISGSVPSNLQRNPDSVLIPTQVKPYMNDKSHNTQMSNINIAEFETVASDPFDTAALNSINDMEELAKVLATTNIPQPMTNVNYSQSQIYGTNSIPFTANPYSYYKPSRTQPQYNVPYTQQPHIRPYSGQDNLQNIYCPTYPNVSHPVPATQYKNKYQHAHSPPTGPFTTSNHINDYSYRVSDQVSNSAPFKRQDLEDFYTKYYANKTKEANGCRSGDITPNSDLKNSLCSSASVPDLTLEDEEVLSINKLKQSKPISGVRPSSTGIHHLQENICSRVNKVIHQPRLPDPFAELNPSAQELVQNVSEMGFPRPRVARAVQKLGTDHKKLIEVLLALQNFQENGESEYAAEVAFYYYMGDLDKVKQFLPTSKQLVNLGFGEEKVVEALFKSNNDCTKALEELVA